MENARRKTFSISQAAGMCGVTAKQIRHWEGRRYLPEPERVVCGERSYRKYGQDDLEIIRSIKAYLDLGYTLPAAAKKAAEKHGREEENEDA